MDIACTCGWKPNQIIPPSPKEYLFSIIESIFGSSPTPVAPPLPSEPPRFHTAVSTSTSSASVVPAPAPVLVPDSSSSSSSSSAFESNTATSASTTATLTSTPSLPAHASGNGLGGLYLSHRPSCRRCAYALQSMNIASVLDLTATVGQYEETCSELNITRLKIEIQDASTVVITQKVFSEAFQFIDRARKGNKGVLVHCEAGISRSPSVVIGYLMYTRFCATLEEAFIHTIRCRPIIQPNYGFMKQLALWEQTITQSEQISDFYYEYVLQHHNLLHRYSVDQLKDAEQRNNGNIMNSLLDLLKV